MLKMLLYCIKNKPNIVRGLNNEFYISNAWKSEGIDDFKLNDKIIGECEFEVEKYLTEKSLFSNELRIVNKHLYEGVAKYSETEEMLDNLLKQSCLNIKELTKYMGTEKGAIIQKDLYAIHIKNLKIYDEPRELNKLEHYNKPKCDNCPFEYSLDSDCEYYKEVNCEGIPIMKAPRNMMYVLDGVEKKILLSASPEEMMNIANRLQTIIVRKTVLKEMV